MSLQSTPSLFLGCRASFSRAPVRGAQPDNLHLLGTHGLAAHTTELASPVGFDLVEQRLLHDTQSACRCHALPTFDQPDRFALELQRVTRARRFRHFRSTCLD